MGLKRLERVTRKNERSSVSVCLFRCLVVVSVTSLVTLFGFSWWRLGMYDQNRDAVNDDFMIQTKTDDNRFRNRKCAMSLLEKRDSPIEESALNVLFSVLTKGKNLSEMANELGGIDEPAVWTRELINAALSADSSGMDVLLQSTPELFKPMAQNSQKLWLDLQRLEQLIIVIPNDDQNSTKVDYLMRCVNGMDDRSVIHRLLMSYWIWMNINDNEMELIHNDDMHQSFKHFWKNGFGQLLSSLLPSIWKVCPISNLCLVSKCVNHDPQSYSSVIIALLFFSQSHLNLYCSDLLETPIARTLESLRNKVKYQMCLKSDHSPLSSMIFDDHSLWKSIIDYFAQDITCYSSMTEQLSFKPET